MLDIPEVSDAAVAFPTTTPLPAWEDLTEDFQRGRGEAEPWHRIVSKIFFEGGRLSDFGLTPKDGVDVNKAMRAILVCLGSWEPKHEHKTAGVAFMLSEWFDAA